VRLAIIGAGIAGLACADRLRDGGIDTVIFDKGRGAGGRMSTRRIETSAGTAHIDHGAQYFTVRDHAFRTEVDAWAALGWAARWPPAGPDAWVGSPTMNAPIRHLAARHNVHFEHHAHGFVRSDDMWWVRLEGGLEGPFDGVVTAIPAEQAAPILALHDLDMAKIAMTARSQPCWTAMIVFDGPLGVPVGHFRDAGIIGWAACNRAKPDRDGPEAWVVQGTASWSAAHIENQADGVATRLLDALASHAGGATLPPVLSITAHRWRFAMTRGTDKGALWNDRLSLGACGDWLLGPRVELAWLSGRQLGDHIAEAAVARAGA
jgi:renalase